MYHLHVSCITVTVHEVINVREIDGAQMYAE